MRRPRQAGVVDAWKTEKRFHMTCRQDQWERQIGQVNQEQQTGIRPCQHEKEFELLLTQRGTLESFQAEADASLHLWKVLETALCMDGLNEAEEKLLLILVFSSQEVTITLIKEMMERNKNEQNSNI